MPQRYQPNQILQHQMHFGDSSLPSPAAGLHPLNIIGSRLCEGFTSMESSNGLVGSPTFFPMSHQKRLSFLAFQKKTKLELFHAAIECVCPFCHQKKSTKTCPHGRHQASLPPSTSPAPPPPRRLRSQLAPRALEPPRRLRQWVETRISTYFKPNISRFSVNWLVGRVQTWYCLCQSCPKCEFDIVLTTKNQTS